MCKDLNTVRTKEYLWLGKSKAIDVFSDVKNVVKIWNFVEIIVVDLNTQLRLEDS